MPKVQHTATLHEGTVQRVAQGESCTPLRTRGKATRPRNSCVQIKHWYDGVDPLLVQWVRSNHIFWRRIEVVSPTELIIH